MGSEGSDPSAFGGSLNGISPCIPRVDPRGGNPPDVEETTVSAGRTSQLAALEVLAPPKNSPIQNLKPTSSPAEQSIFSGIETSKPKDYER